MDDSSSEDIPPHSRLSAGCVLCFEGAKLVLFITGLCQRSCWFCPLSAQRKDKDVIFANEHKISGMGKLFHIKIKLFLLHLLLASTILSSKVTFGQSAAKRITFDAVEFVKVFSFDDVNILV